MKIKIERYEYTPSESRYRAYHGFTGIPFYLSISYKMGVG